MPTNRVRRVQIGDELRLFAFAGNRPASTPPRLLFEDLIRFANKRTDDSGAPLKPALKTSALFGVGNDNEFYSDSADAHSLVRRALAECAKHGNVTRKTEHSINKYLSAVWTTTIYSIDQGELNVWADSGASSSAATCAHALALLVGSEQTELVRRCELEECGIFFWAPIRRGQRPRHCCDEHRWRDSKRKNKGQ